MAATEGSALAGTGSGPGSDRPIRLVALPGDGIGPEVVREAMRVLGAAAGACGFTIDHREFPCGGRYYLETGREWPPEAFETCRDWSDAVLLGAVGWPDAWLPTGDLAGAGVVFGLRMGLDLYANVRPCKLYGGVRHRVHDAFLEVWKPGRVDFVIVRENTEGCYVPARGGLRRGGTLELSVDSRVITRRGALRVIRHAFELARSRRGAPADGRRRVTCIDKSNVLAGCQLFRQVYEEVAAEYPEIDRDYAYIDAFTQAMMREPELYDVCVTTNLFGDIATDLASVLQGGMGIAAGANLGEHHGMFEGVHGSAPRLAGKDVANPMATVLAAQMMLEWLGSRMGDERLVRGARLIEKAVAQVVAQGEVLTPDLGGRCHTSEVGTALVVTIGQLAGGAP